MRDVRAILADLCSTKLTPDQFALIAELSASAAASAAKGPDETAEERRKRISRETSRRHRASQNVTDASPDVTEECVTECHQTSPGDTNASPPRARGLDKPFKLVISGSSSLDYSASEPDQPIDDWPKGDLAQALVEASAQPSLNPHRTPNLITTAAQILAWKRAGASWEFDVLPTVKGLAAQHRGKISTWKFFDDAIGRSIADNRRALEIPDAAPRRASTGPPSSLADRIGAENAEARRRAFEMMDARDAAQNG